MGCLVPKDGLGAPSRSAGPSGDGRGPVDQVDGLSDVVDVGRCADHVQRSALPTADQVVFAARLSAVDWRRAGRGTPFFART